MSKLYKLCTGKNGCNGVLPLDQFATDKSSVDGHYRYCRSCERKYQKKMKKAREKHGMGLRELSKLN